MLLSHVSDTHGYFPPISPETKIIVHSGDLCPNKTRGFRDVEVPYQTKWIIKEANNFKKWIGDRPFIFCRGNHDFAPDICKLLRRYGNINAIDITSRKVTIEGIKFYGFPFIPFIAGECTASEMHREICTLKNELENYVDVLVSHCPPYGILDADFVIRDGLDGPLSEPLVPNWASHLGNSHLTNLLSYNLDPKYYPKYLLCGHIHSHHSITEKFGITISNAATVVNQIKIYL